MSLTDKFAILMQRPGGDNAQKDDVPFWMRYAGRGLGIVGGFLGILFGLLNCTGIFLLSVSSLLAGIWQMLAGFAVLVCEAPCCCFFIDYVQVLSDKMEGRPYWNKAVLYCGLGIVPFIINFLSVSTFLGSGLVFGAGVLYGMMALGKKGTIEEMRSSAANIEAGLGQPTTKPHATLVANEQPVSFTGAPVRH